MKKYTNQKNNSKKKYNNKNKKGGDYTLYNEIQHLEEPNNVSTANKPIYFGNGENPFKYTINIAKNLDTGLYKNNPLEWKLWTIKNIGGKKRKYKRNTRKYKKKYI